MKKRGNPKDNTAFDPPTRVTDDGRYIHISISLPSVAEEHIRIDLEKTTVTLSITGDGKILRKSIRIPCEARFFRKKFSDGALEIVLEKLLP